MDKYYLIFGLCILFLLPILPLYILGFYKLSLIFFVIAIAMVLFEDNYYKNLKNKKFCEEKI